MNITPELQLVLVTHLKKTTPSHIAHLKISEISSDVYNECIDWLKKIKGEFYTIKSHDITSIDIGKFVGLYPVQFDDYNIYFCFDYYDPHIKETWKDWFILRNEEGELDAPI